ncbi:MAG: alpha/beta hydrolase-fold protein, partial [Candidatus Sumerlaeota bacterium]|nr:alpha/beta hydrolase-fold protein [Candidatus Sumerlaeota bacterium]
ASAPGKGAFAPGKGPRPGFMPGKAQGKAAGGGPVYPAPPGSKYGYGAMNWVDPDTTPPEGGLYKTFHSPTINADASYIIYLPPDYDKDPSVRYPVLYNLHASGGTPKRDGADVIRRMDAAIRAGRIPPLIIVCPNGLAGNTMYCDSRDGQYPVETVIVKNLVAHVDSTYRTVAAREGRALDGFSMGGFGAAHLGFKYPEVFGVISIMAPPLLGPELTTGLPAQAWSRLFPSAMDGDLDYFRANDPFTLIVKNADAIRDRTAIRLVCHTESENWLAPQCEKLHGVMVQQMIPHQFDFLVNVKSHSRGQVMDTLGDSGLAWFSSGFDWVQSVKSHPGSAPARMSMPAAGRAQASKPVEK